MKVIHVLRKPLSEKTVAKNVLKHGTGGLNIDASRIGTDGGSTIPSGMDRLNARLAEQGYRPGTYQRGAPPPPKPGGRWPANLILQHKPGCRCVGTKKVKGITGGTTSGGNALGQDAGWNSHQNRPTGISRQMDKDGNESIADWDCVPDCPVAALDEQTEYDDTGGASRFFKQVGGQQGDEP